MPSFMSFLGDTWPTDLLLAFHERQGACALLSISIAAWPHCAAHQDTGFHDMRAERDGQTEQGHASYKTVTGADVMCECCSCW